MKGTTKQPTDIEEIIRRLCGGDAPPPRAATTQPVAQPVAPHPSSFQKNTEIENARLREELVLAKETSKNIQGLKDLCLSLEHEVLSLKKKETSFIEEKALLQAQIEEQKEHTQTEKTCFSSGFKLLEEKILLLTEEKDAFTQKTVQLAEALKEKEDSLFLEKKLVSDLTSSLEAKKQETLELSKEKEVLEHKNSALLDQISLLNLSLNEEKSHKDIIALSVKSNQDHLNELRREIETLHTALQEKEEHYATLKQHKEKGDARLKEIEEHLVIKLQEISDLTEELHSAQAGVEEWKSKHFSSTQELACIKEKNEYLTQDLESLTSQKNVLEGRIKKANDYIVELRVKLESFERLKNTYLEASSHVRKLSSLFGPTPQTLPSLQNLIESFVIKQKQPSSHQEGLAEAQELF